MGLSDYACQVIHSLHGRSCHTAGRWSQDDLRSVPSADGPESWPSIWGLLCPCGNHPDPSCVIHFYSTTCKATEDVPNILFFNSCFRPSVDLAASACCPCSLHFTRDRARNHFHASFRSIGPVLEPMYPDPTVTMTRILPSEPDVCLRDRLAVQIKVPDMDEGRLCSLDFVRRQMSVCLVALMLACGRIFWL